VTGQNRRPVALTIAGSDSGGGAGIVADLKTFEAHGVWGTVALVAVTAQNTLGVQAFEAVAPELVRAQITSVVGDLGVDAAKTGMLASAEMVETVAATVKEFGVRPLVVDPVFVSKHGDTLLADDAVGALRDHLLPLAAVVTPNLPEAAALVGFDVTDRAAMEKAARSLVDLGPDAVLMKGGHLGDDRSPPRRRWVSPGLPGRRRRGARVARRLPDPRPPHPRHRLRPVGGALRRAGPGNGPGRRLRGRQAVRGEGHRRGGSTGRRRGPGRPRLGPRAEVASRRWTATASTTPRSRWCSGGRPSSTAG
jgi:hydroxymethylpyrimidine kinase/phosphomethylpyrimidine kinase